MSVISTKLAELSRGLRSEFKDLYTSMDAAAIYQRIATRIASEHDSENYQFLGSLPQMREWGTGRVAQGLESFPYSIPNKKYESTIEVDRDEISDDKTGQIRTRIQQMTQTAARHKDYLIALLLTNGGSAGFHSYDGVPFFGANHASGASGNQDNDLTFDATNHAAVTSAEFKQALREARTAMLSFKDDRGNPMSVDGKGGIVLVPPALYDAAREAVGASVIGNTTNVDQGMADVVVFPWLTSAVEWFLLKTDGILRPFVFQDREPMEFKQQAEGSDEEFRREKYLYGVRARYAMTYGPWQYAVRSTFN